MLLAPLAVCVVGLLQERVDDFVEVALEQARAYAGSTPDASTSDIMMYMGEDFTYGNARMWYDNLDKLIHYVNLDGRINAFYSTPLSYARVSAGRGCSPSFSVPPPLPFPPPCA